MTKTNKRRTTNKVNKTNKPSFEEWYNSLSKPSKLAFKVGFRYALQLKQQEEQIKKVLAM